MPHRAPRRPPQHVPSSATNTADSTTLGGNLSHAINFRALCGANLVTYSSDVQTNETREVLRVDLLLYTGLDLRPRGRIAARLPNRAPVPAAQRPINIYMYIYLYLYIYIYTSLIRTRVVPGRQLNWAGLQRDSHLIRTPAV